MLFHSMWHLCCTRLCRCVNEHVAECRQRMDESVCKHCRWKFLSLLFSIFWSCRPGPCNTNRICSKSVRSGSRTSPLVTPAPTEHGFACPKCGVIKRSRSGSLSCCTRGGAWFKNCGDEGDNKFDHTWSEGIRACARKLMDG